MQRLPKLRTVLFDLDGTLADTAPDLAAALNEVRAEHGLPPLPYERIRCQVSNGATALIRLGFGGDEHSPEFAALRSRLLELYRAGLAVHTRLFAGMEETLARIEQEGRNWGVVTNKPAWLTEPLLASLDIAHRAVCVVSGDSTENRKPHPEPLLEASRRAGSPPARCVYVGDSPRDIQAGRAAGMHTLVALFGYIPADEEPAGWGADALIEHPADLLDYLHYTDAAQPA